VNKETGRVLAKHLYGAIDAGLVVNPGIVEAQITGQLVQTASRMFKEEITFNQTNVTSLDWNSYPILRFDESPEVTPRCRATAERTILRCRRRSDGCCCGGYRECVL
jgi:CO/xanthine dehydrogenase Mo-binding subunit